jgi:nitrogen fixation/metabolism regulation signal transduction histidine kinase
MNYTNRNLISFFDSLKYDDSAVIINEEFNNQDFLRLSKRFQKVNRQILQLKAENIQQDVYFKTVTEHASVGLFGFDENGKVKLCNKAFKNLFHIDTISNINQLNKIDSDFENLFIHIKPSEQKLIKLNINNKIVQLSIRATQFKTKKEKIKLISVQDIKNELDEKELESWQKLTQILRHEIMNSIGPISSTIETLNEIITNPENNEPRKTKDLNDEIIQDLASGLRIVQERNRGIQNFIDKYRSISKIPKPHITQVNIKELLQNIEKLWLTKFEENNIQFKIEIEDTAEIILADKNLVEQVLINLIKNAIEALNEHTNPQIKVVVHFNSNNKQEIKVINNGPYIEKEILDKIFFPFFTTKTEGSGIGLSLSQQIMRTHGGNISVQSNESETVFTLQF